LHSVASSHCSQPGIIKLNTEEHQQHFDKQRSVRSTATKKLHLLLAISGCTLLFFCGEIAQRMRVKSRAL